MYCSAEAARQTLINKGWGDGIVGDQNGAHSHFPADGSDIADGGPVAAPDATLVFTNSVIDICIGEDTVPSLTSSQDGYFYLLYNKADDSMLGDTVWGTGNAIDFTNLSPTDTSTYYVITGNPEVLGSSCYTVRLVDELTINVVPLSNAGTIVASQTEVCIDGSSVLTVSGHVGAVTWQSASDAAFTNIINADLGSGISYTVPTSVAGTVYYRLKSGNGVCGEGYSDVIGVTVYPISVGGDLYPGRVTMDKDTTITTCSGSSAYLRLENEVGDVVRWESSTDNFVTISDAVHISNTNTFHETGLLTET
ncbi:MAG: hypothetical protein ACK5LV_10030, partial [Lachnospirales bacterium]